MASGLKFGIRAASRLCSVKWSSELTQPLNPTFPQLPQSSAPDVNPNTRKFDFLTPTAIRLMVYILQYLKDPKLWELWSIPFLIMGSAKDSYHQPWHPVVQNLERSSHIPWAEPSSQEVWAYHAETRSRPECVGYSGCFHIKGTGIRV